MVRAEISDDSIHVSSQDLPCRMNAMTYMNINRRLPLSCLSGEHPVNSSCALRFVVFAQNMRPKCPEVMGLACLCDILHFSRCQIERYSPQHVAHSLLLRRCGDCNNSLLHYPSQKNLTRIHSIFVGEFFNDGRHRSILNLSKRD